jgi:hypothetical protein
MTTLSSHNSILLNDSVAQEFAPEALLRSSASSSPAIIKHASPYLATSRRCFLNTLRAALPASVQFSHNTTVRASLDAHGATLLESAVYDAAAADAVDADVRWKTLSADVVIAADGADSLLQQCAGVVTSRPSRTGELSINGVVTHEQQSALLAADLPFDRDELSVMRSRGASHWYAHVEPPVNADAGDTGGGIGGGGGVSDDAAVVWQLTVPASLVDGDVDHATHGDTRSHCLEWIDAFTLPPHTRALLSATKRYVMIMQMFVNDKRYSCVPIQFLFCLLHMHNKTH